MATNSGGHDCRYFENGVSVHLVSPPKRNWFIRSFDWSWVTGQMLWTRQVFAQSLGWDALEFETKEAAYAFVNRYLQRL